MQQLMSQLQAYIFADRLNNSSNLSHTSILNVLDFNNRFSGNHVELEHESDIFCLKQMHTTLS